MRNSRWYVAIGVNVLAVGTASAGLFQDLYRGLDLLATPSGSPVFTTGDGTRANGARTGRVRILPDSLGRGYSLEFDRSFGVDSAGRPESFDLGPLDLTLNGATQMTAGFTRRGFLIGNIDMATNNLQYSLRGRTGATNTEVNGTLNVNNSLEINQFGFYTLTMNVSNTSSQVLVDGVLQDGFDDADFSIGPVNIQGNIFVDGLASLLNAFGVDTTGLEQLFPRSPINTLADAIADATRRDDIATALGREVNSSLLTNPMLEFGNAAVTATALAAYQNATLGRTLAGSNESAAPLPEPSTLALLSLAGAALLRRR